MYFGDVAGIHFVVNDHHPKQKQKWLAFMDSLTKPWPWMHVQIEGPSARWLLASPFPQF